MDVETGRPNKKDIALMDVETDVDSRGSSNIMSGLQSSRSNVSEKYKKK